MDACCELVAIVSAGMAEESGVSRGFCPFAVSAAPLRAVRPPNRERTMPIAAKSSSERISHRAPTYTTVITMVDTTHMPTACSQFTASAPKSAPTNAYTGSSRTMPTAAAATAAAMALPYERAKRMPSIRLPNRRRSIHNSSGKHRMLPTDTEAPSAVTQYCGGNRNVAATTVITCTPEAANANTKGCLPSSNAKKVR